MEVLHNFFADLRKNCENDELSFYRFFGKRGASARPHRNGGIFPRLFFKIGLDFFFCWITISKEQNGIFGRYDNGRI